MEDKLNQTLHSPKRKRGRPCKAETVPLSRETAAFGVPSSDAKSVKAAHKDSSSLRQGLGSNSLIGQTVHGVLDGSFDAGYLITVRVGESDTIFRGVVFGPGLSISPSKINDAAPNVKHAKRDTKRAPNPVPTRVTLPDVLKPAPIIDSAEAPNVVTDMEAALKSRLEVPRQQNEFIGVARMIPDVSNAINEANKLEICDPVEAIQACLRKQSEDTQNDANTFVQPIEEFKIKSEGV